jgi:hypothetical protein
MKPRRRLETTLAYDVLSYLGRYPGVTVWRNNTGALRDVNGRVVKFGCPGSADIFAVVEPHGRFFGIETKSPSGVQSPIQRNWSKAIERRGGVYILARSIEDVQKWFPPVGAGPHDAEPSGADPDNTDSPAQ